MKRVLIVSYFFPPDGGPGTQRAAKFCKYLREFGWEPTVITRQAGPKRSIWTPEDPELVSDVGPGTQVIRVVESTRAKGWAASLPKIDIGRPWLDSAYDAVHLANRDNPPDVVLITMSPFDLCFLGRRLRADIDVPVVYDLRDPWALDGWRMHGTKRRWVRDYTAMVDTLANADGVIANTPESAKAFLKAVPALNETRLATIPNGYDHGDFKTPAQNAPCGNERGLFQLIHTGTLHTNNLYRYEGLLGSLKRWRHYRSEPIDTSGRTPVHLLRAMRILKDRHHPLASILRLILVGPIDAATERCVRESGLADQVQCVGYVSHRDSVTYVRRADALFLPLHNLPDGRRSLIVPGKTYEYLAAGRPILACLPQGDAHDLVKNSGQGACVPPCDAPAIAAQLDELYRGWNAGHARPAEAPPWLAQYERRALTEKLAVFLEQTVAAAA